MASKHHMLAVTSWLMVPLFVRVKGEDSKQKQFSIYEVYPGISNKVAFWIDRDEPVQPP